MELSLSYLLAFLVLCIALAIACIVTDICLYFSKKKRSVQFVLASIGSILFASIPIALCLFGFLAMLLIFTLILYNVMLTILYFHKHSEKPR